MLSIEKYNGTNNNSIIHNNNNMFFFYIRQAFPNSQTAGIFSISDI